MPPSTPHSPRSTLHPRGFTLIEMATTVALLIIILGLMVSLARYVRETSAHEVSKDMLRKLDAMMGQYMARHGGSPPAVTPFPGPGDVPDETAAQRTAWLNNRDFLRVLRSEALFPPDAFGGLPETIYNEATLRDAWGSPIVFMPAMHPAVGMALQNKPFFFSAGPDRKYLTQEDNLYSYEEVGAIGSGAEAK